MNINRRGFLRGLLAVAATAAMPVRAAIDFICPDFERYTSYFRWNIGPENLCDDWRYVARIANIETTDGPVSDIFVPLAGGRIELPIAVSSAEIGIPIERWRPDEHT